MKYLVVSDSHGYHVNLKKVIERVGPVAGIFHAGDVQCDPILIEELSGCPVHVVAGNNDRRDNLDNEKILMIEGHRVGIVHGHNHNVYYGLMNLTYWALEKQVELVIYGHTHVPNLKYEGEITLLNPGSISLPRQEGHLPTYALIDIDKKGDIHVTIKEFKE